MLWLQIAAAAAIAAAALGAGAALTVLGPWYYGLRRPRWTPPDRLFGPAWTTIFVLAAWAGVLAWRGAADGPGRALVLGLFGLNLALNVIWSALFFRARRMDLALVEVVPLWLSILAIMVLLRPFNGAVPWLLAPYLIWVTYASTVNWGYVRLNPRRVPGQASSSGRVVSRAGP